MILRGIALYSKKWNILTIFAQNFEIQVGKINFFLYIIVSLESYVALILYQAKNDLEWTRMKANWKLVPRYVHSREAVEENKMKKLVNLKLVENSLKNNVNSFDFCTCWRHVAQKYMSPDVYQC